MPFADNRGIQIHYEVEGSGPPLVLHHGTSGSWEDWKDLGYLDALRRRFQVILLDARGHGASAKPHDPAAYALPLRVADVTAVLDALRIPQAHFFGYSLGGWVGFGLAKHAPERLLSLVLGGAHPYAEDMSGLRARMPADPALFIAVAERTHASLMTPAFRARLLANDLQALAISTQDRPPMEDVLPAIGVPCLLFAGESDPRLPQVREAANRIPRAAFFSLPAADHIVALTRADLVLPQVIDFLIGL